MEGVIIENVANIYKVKIDDKIYKASARGRLKQGEISPVVGDEVEIEEVDKIKSIAVISKILPRTNYIKRPKMANLDKLVLVVSSVDPKPDVVMLDKQLAFAEYLNIIPLIVLNKIDLDGSKQLEALKLEYEKIGYKVIGTNAKTKEGIRELLSFIKNSKSAFSGNSGVGKSSLINAIFENQITLEGEISKKNKKGKNTTTIIKLYEIDNNTYIADTPGFSTFEINEINSKDIAKYFVEFRRYIDKCEYIDCTHIKEEQCGIKKAVDENQISLKRYERFIKIYEELKEKENKKW